MCRIVNDDRQQAVLEGVIAKNLGDLATDHGAKTKIQQRPRRMLARGTAAEVAARNQYRTTARFRLIQNEIGFDVALRVVAPIGKRVLAQAFLRGRREKARRNNL